MLLVLVFTFYKKKKVGLLVMSLAFFAPKKMRNTELKFTGCAKYVKYVFGSNFKCVVSDNTMLHNTESKIPLSIYKKRFFSLFFLLIGLVLKCVSHLFNIG